MTASEILSGTELSATEAWSRRVLRIGGFIQVAFAAFWLLRGSLTVGAVGLALTAMSAVVVGAVGGYGIRATAGAAPRFTTAEAKRSERAVTAATVIQLVASLAVPAIVIAAGHDDSVLPSIAVTIGPLLPAVDPLARSDRPVKGRISRDHVACCRGRAVGHRSPRGMTQT